MEEATVGRGGATEDSWSWLGLVLSARRGHRGAVRVGLTSVVADGFWWDLLFGVVRLDGLGQLLGVQGQRNALQVILIILGFRGCRNIIYS